ncbi:translation initiation factor eIF 4e-like domain-containing protein [Pyronema domesticum]|nr:translation initiation factor eIF 4e-like domain-containing protein [Pyronema domesticum]
MESSNPLWNRRTNNSSTKLSLSMSSHHNASASPSTANIPGETPTSRLFGPPASARAVSSHRSKNPFDLHAINTSNALPSPTAGPKSASAAFNLGAGGAFGSFGFKTPKTPGTNGNDALSAAGATLPTTPGLLGKGGLTASEVVAGGKKPVIPPVPESHPLKDEWVVWYRSPGNKFQDYEKSTHKIAHFKTVEEFWTVYSHLKRPSNLPHVSDYHLFKKGIRPVWEDKENRAGGKWNIRLKKGVANRYWEDLMLAIVGDQFGDAGDDLCGAVLSVRGNEDVLSVWTRVDGSSCLKIRQTVMTKLALPAGTRIDWKSHATSLEAVNNKTAPTTTPAGVSQQTQ